MFYRRFVAAVSSRLWLSIAASLVIASAPTIAPAAAEKPNIVLIVGDDMGYADVGFHGCRDIPTPHLDALAASGVRFTNGYVSGPYCSPTRAGLITGRYQQRFGHEFNPAGGQGLPTTETTLPDRLRSAGYKTGMVGKWHLGEIPAMRPPQRGFDEFFGFYGGSHDYFNSAGVVRGDQPANEKEYLTDAFGREAVAYIERHRREPFFLYLTFNAVHTPMQADDPRLEKFASIENPRRRTCAAMMSAMDDAVGRVVAKLAETKLTEKTLVMFISDNGGPVMLHTTVNGSNNAPLRGSKRTTLEGGIRVPFLVAWPGKLQSGTYERPVIQLDLHATALAAAGIDPKTTKVALDGVDLLPFLIGDGKPAAEKSPHDALFWRFGAQMAVRMGDYKLVRYDMNAEGPDAVAKQPLSNLKLYNLADDIGEANDLSTKMPYKVKELQARWDAWNAELVPPLWGSSKTTTGGKAEGNYGGRKQQAKKSE
jgi:arylsulfatase A-like enzyme